MGLKAWLNHAKRISQLEEGLLKLISRMDECELDWVEARARCKRLLDRTEKAARVVDRAEAVVESNEAGNNGEMAEVPTIGGHLSPHQKQVQQKILRRRAGISDGLLPG